MLQPNTLIAAYRIEQSLGAGGMGRVYRARHLVSARVVALKLLREDQLAQHHAIDRMMREASILASVAHPGIPRLYECGLLDDRRPWIAMELIDGCSLATRMQRGRICAGELLELVAEVAGVLAAAHARGVTHRDLKPDNIVLTPGDPTFPLRVIDWGIAHHVTGARFTGTNEALGTPTYMAPEQAGGGPTGGHCDVYGLGVIAYQALAGRAPFVGASGVEILVQHLHRALPALAPRCPEAPVELVELVERMLCKHHADRPSAAVVATALAALRGVVEPAGVDVLRDDAVPVSIPDDGGTPATTRIHRPHAGA